MKRFSINNLDYEKRKKVKLIALIALIVVLNALLIWVFATNSGDKSTENTLADTRVHETEVPEGYTAIYNVDGLKAMSSNLSGKYILMSDIDLTGNTWDVIGTSSSSAFTGTLDGNNYTISNMNIESSNQYVGMFGYTNGATIKNLTLENISVKSTYTATSTSTYGYVGGLVGYATGTSSLKTTIENVGIIGTSKVESITTGANGVYIGGLVGYANNYTTITNAYSNAEVIGNVIKGAIYIGGFAGYTDGTITNAYATGKVTATSTSGEIDVGGLIGVTRGTTTNVYSIGEVTATSATGTIFEGGLVGYTTGASQYSSNASTITNAYSTSNITGKSTSGFIKIGGLVGQTCNSSNYYAKLNNTYAVGKINAETTGITYIGGLIGYVYSNSNTTVTRSYWSPETTGVDTSATTSETPKLLQEMLYLNTYTDWDFDTVWDIDEGNTLPYLQGMSKPESVNESNYTYLRYDGEGTEDNPYIIRSKEQLQGVKYSLLAHYKLENDIDLIGIENFEPIGNSTTPFAGTLDGAGFTISNINIESANQYVGMFGYVSSGTIRNLILKDIVVKSTYASNYGRVGGLVGTATGTNTLITKIENVGIIGQSKIENVNVSSNYNVYIGGLVGEANCYSSITNAYSMADVVGNAVTGTLHAGGLVGVAYGVITNAYSTGDVTATTTTGAIYTGGLVGQTRGLNAGYMSRITNAYSTSNVIGKSTSGAINIGGLAGRRRCKKY